MNRLQPAKLHVRCTAETTPRGRVVPRRYTLTHSDRTGELYLTIGAAYDRAQANGWYARFMRDEVLAEWQEREAGLALHVHCHVSGGLVVGTARWRDAIFRHELPLVLEAFRYGDRALYATHPALDAAPVWVHFHSTRPLYDRVEQWGTPSDYA